MEAARDLNLRWQPLNLLIDELEDEKQQEGQEKGCKKRGMLSASKRNKTYYIKFPTWRN